MTPEGICLEGPFSGPGAPQEAQSSGLLCESTFLRRCRNQQEDTSITIGSGPRGLPIDLRPASPQSFLSPPSVGSESLWPSASDSTRRRGEGEGPRNLPDPSGQRDLAAASNSGL